MRKLQAGPLLGNGTRSMHILYKCVCTYYHYDAKPQSVKTSVAAKPSGISPNHTCQYSLVTLSYRLSLSHFSTADHL